MGKVFAAALVLFAAVHAGYVTWLAGYRAGYDEGATQAWDNARSALMPRDELADGTSPQFRPAALSRIDAR